MSVESGVAESG